LERFSKAASEWTGRTSADELRGLQARFAQLAELGAGGHAVSIVDVAELPVDVPRNETD
jgi:hypothetical protein